jgi:hypothetical protein
MRIRHLLVVAMVVLPAAALLAASVSARPTAALNNPVHITNKGCTIGYRSAGPQYTTVVFGVFNDGTVSHGFDISGRYKTGLIKPHQERTLVTHFRPAGYRWACVSAHSTVGRGTFTIR